MFYVFACKFIRLKLSKLTNKNSLFSKFQWYMERNQKEVTKAVTFGKTQYKTNELQGTVLFVFCLKSFVNVDFKFVLKRVSNINSMKKKIVFFFAL